MVLTKTIFCANEQKETAHELTAAPNGEVISTCVECGRSLKFAADIIKEEFEKQLAAHKEANAGQVTQESIDLKLAELADKVE